MSDKKINELKIFCKQASEATKQTIETLEIESSAQLKKARKENSIPLYERYQTTIMEMQRQKGKLDIYLTILDFIK